MNDAKQLAICIKALERINMLIENSQAGPLDILSQVHSISVIAIREILDEAKAETPDYS